MNLVPMKSLFLAFAAAMVLASCSSTPDETPIASRVDCRNVDPPTGSNYIRRRDCRPVADTDPIK